MTRKLSLFLFISMYLFVSGHLMADKHIVLEQVRKYMNQTFPRLNTNIWVSGNNFSIRSLSSVIIYRGDLGKIWRIVPFRNKYYEEDISKPEIQSEQKKQISNIHKIGQEFYDPQFDWQLDPHTSTDTARGYKCVKFTANGDADYADDTIELWGTKESPVKMDETLKTAFEYYSEDNHKTVRKLFPILNDYLIVKMVEKINHSISPITLIETVISKQEDTASPANMYELPKGCIKVNSIDDLYK